MLKATTEAGRGLAVMVFRLVCSRQDDKGWHDRKYFETFHQIAVNNVTLRALPVEFGPWKSVWKRSWRLSKVGLSAMFFEILASLSETAHLVQKFDSNVVRAHVSAAGAKGVSPRRHPVDHASFLSTKIHLKTDRGGHPLPFALMRSEQSDSRESANLLDLRPNIQPRAVVADKGYSAKANRALVRRRCIAPVIPCKTNTKVMPAFFLQLLYCSRARIEQMLGRSNASRSGATKLPRTSQASPLSLTA